MRAEIGNCSNTMAEIMGASGVTARTTRFCSYPIVDCRSSAFCVCTPCHCWRQ
ncbi:Uncharacterised protein [Mycobacteroides abscessus subsp. abscessus]|nr:Uncharacterised protein [Mycobacteroides abscessus subsp. abscessus]